MKTKSVLYIVVVLLLMSNCRKKDDDAGQNVNKEVTYAQLSEMMNLQEEAVVKYQTEWKKSGDTLKAIFEMGKWLRSQPGVSNVYVNDEFRISIEYSSGISSSITFSMVGANGIHPTRGNSSGISREGGISKFVVGGNGKRDEKIIKNNKVLILSPHNVEFYGSEYPFIKHFEKSRNKMEITLVTDRAATLQVFNTVSDYGFVIINTHGGSDGSFQMYTGVKELDIPSTPKAGTWTEESMKQYIELSGNPNLKKLLNGELRLSYLAVLDLFNPDKEAEVSRILSITDEYVANMPNKLNDAVVFGNHCYSGNIVSYQTDFGRSGNFPDAWKKAGASSYYGYAYDDGYGGTVDQEFCIRMEDSLIMNLVKNGDSTGIAHLNNGVTERFYINRRRLVQTVKIEDTVFFVFSKKIEWGLDKQMLKLYHSPRYKYGCGTYTDPRDGEVYQLACIGDQVWFSENLRYNISGSLAYDNDESKVKRWGRLYNYTMVSAGAGIGQSPSQPGFKGICPDGYHVPSDYDWQKLIKKLKPGVNEVQQLKSKSTDWEDDDDDLNDPNRNLSGMSFLPAGQGVIFSNENNRLEFFDGGNLTTIWAASLLNESKPENHPYSAGALTINSYNIIYSNLVLGVDMSVAPYIFYSCRCVKDE